jgi:YD repeat-containing protein
MFGDGTYLVPAFIDVDRKPTEVVTVYRTEQSRKILEGRVLKATYDATTDTLSIILKADACVVESDEDKPDVSLDYDEQGNLVSLEILNASKRVSEARRIEFELTG